MFPTTSHDDRRREDRYTVANGRSIHATIHRTVDGRTESVKAKIVDLSQSGAKVELPVSLSFAESIELNLSVANLGLSITATSQVCWIRPAADNQWLMGCSFSPRVSKEAMDDLAAAGIVDRRNQSRHRVEIMATACWESEREPFPVVLRDYSANGFCMSSIRPGKVGQGVLVDLNTLGESDRDITGRVRWQIEWKGEYLIGCAMNDQEDLDRLCELGGLTLDGPPDMWMKVAQYVPEKYRRVLLPTASWIAICIASTLLGMSVPFLWHLMSHPAEAGGAAGRSVTLAQRQVEAERRLNPTEVITEGPPAQPSESSQSSTDPPTNPRPPGTTLVLPGKIANLQRNEQHATADPGPPPTPTEPPADDRSDPPQAVADNQPPNPPSAKNPLPAAVTPATSATASSTTRRAKPNAPAPTKHLPPTDHPASATPPFSLAASPNSPPLRASGPDRSPSTIESSPRPDASSRQEPRPSSPDTPAIADPNRPESPRETSQPVPSAMELRQAARQLESVVRTIVDVPEPRGMTSAPRGKAPPLSSPDAKPSRIAGMPANHPPQAGNDSRLAKDAWLSGGEHYRSGQYQQAAVAWRKAVRHAPRNAFYRYLLAMAEYQLGQFDEAELGVRRAVQLERIRPVQSWGQRMARYQGRGRLWIEQHRSAAHE